MPYLDVDQGTPGGINPAAPGLIRIGRGTPGSGDTVTFDASTGQMTTSGGVTAAGPVSGGASVALTADSTVTGTVALSTLLPGYVSPAAALAAGQIFELEAWGVVTTTLAAQTVDLSIWFGGFGGTKLLDMGAQQPNSGAAVTNAAWGIRVKVLALDATHMTSVGWDFYNFFPSGCNQGSPVVVSNAAAAELKLGVTNSSAAVSITAHGGYVRRIQ
jgi:hypothetical protein